MATITVKDASGSDVVIARVQNTGSAADADSLPTALSTESKAQLGDLTETAPASDTASSGLNGRLQRISQRLTSLIAALPASLTDTQLRATPVPVSGTVTITDGSGVITVDGTVAVTNAGITSIDSKVPALGAAASAASTPVVLATNDAQIGTKVTAVTALGAGGAGLIGWLSNIWNAISTQLPASLGIKTAAASLSVAPASDALFVLATSAYSSSQTITRPANQTPYTANDVVGGAIAFTSMVGAAGGRVMITSADMRIEIAAIPSGMTTFRLYLYNVTPPSALADNAAWDLPSGDRAAFMGYVDLGSPADLGSTLFLQVDGINAQRKLGAAETSLYGYLVTNGGFTPAANSEVYVLTLRDVGL